MSSSSESSSSSSESSKSSSSSSNTDDCLLNYENCSTIIIRPSERGNEVLTIPMPTPTPTTTTTMTTTTKPTMMMKMDDNEDIPSSTKNNNEDFSCGIFNWHPHCLQRFANKKCFLTLFCLTSILQGVYYTYFVSVLTTIEKLYQIQSRTIGMVMSSTEIGQISGALLLTYYGGQGHRPRWIATGMLMFACAALLCSTPHYLFGSQQSKNMITVDDNDDGTTSISLSSVTVPMCMINSSITIDQMEICSEKSDSIQQHSRMINFILAIFFMSLLMIGLGTTAVNTLGIPYIDDNVAPKESPLYFGITIGVRIFGPVCGFLLGSVCTGIPVQFPFGTSDLQPNDPNWIGAWWLGLFLVGVSLLLASIPMMIFPRRLPQPDPSSYCHQQQQQQQQQIEQQQQQIEQENLLKSQKITDHHHHQQKDVEHVNQSESITYYDNLSTDNDNSKSICGGGSGGDSGFSQALKRLLTNKILLCRTASSVLHILPISGLYTFLPKYLESQYQLIAGDANIIAGLAGILVMGFGVFASGTFMRRFNPSAQSVAKWIAFAAISHVIGMIILMFLGCPPNQFAGIKQHDSMTGRNYFVGIDQKNLTCSFDCNCPQGRFEPICGTNGITYLSPCLAGCSSIHINNTEKFYTNCKCDHHHPDSSDNIIIRKKIIAKPGICPSKCNTLTLYVIIFSLSALIISTSEVGAMLLTLRCVEPRDKAMALGFISFATGLFGNVPCPILYGTVIDSTCLFWEENCGKLGACRLYNQTNFRQLFHGLTALLMFLGFCIDLIVCYKASAIRFHDDNNDNNDDDDDNNKNEYQINNDDDLNELKIVQHHQQQP